MQEVLLSYKLLVLFDKRARNTFHRATKNISTLKDYDKELDILCLGNPLRSRWHKPYGLRETFYGSSDFPIFAARLSKIQRSIDSIQPNRISSLWRDHRDILCWYTFWTVLILGTVNLGVAILQAGLSAEQVRLARQQEVTSPCS